MDTAEARKILSDIKKAVFKLEKDNTTHIFVYYSGNKWHKIGGNSALILYHIYAQKMEGYKPTLRPDTDYNNKFSRGCISVRDVKKMQEKFNAVGIKRDKSKEMDGQYIFAFKLPKPVSEEELSEIMGKEKLKRDELNETLTLTKLDPELAMLIREVEKITYSIVKKLKPVERELIGHKLLDCAMKMFENYRNWALGEDEKGLEKLMTNIIGAESLMLIIMENDIMSLNDVAEYTFKLEHIKTAINKRYKLKQDKN